MNNIICFAQKIKHFCEVFDVRSYKTFKSVVTWLLCLRDWKQADLAYIWEKTLWQIQYFFSKSIWDFKLFNKLRIQWIRNKIWDAWDKKSDVLVLDGTVFWKNKDSRFSWLADYFYSNKHKKVVNGFEVFWASIYTKSGLKYMLDICMFQKINTKKSWISLLNIAWRKFVTKISSQTKAWLVILDSWFKGWHICKWIHNELKREFLVRIWIDQKFIDKNGTILYIKKCLIEANAIYFSSGKMWVFEEVEIFSWGKKNIHIKVNIIVFHKNWFKNPEVLVTSASLEDIYENMIRKNSEPSRKEKMNQSYSPSLSCLTEESKVYIAFVTLYQKRWSIEVCFHELKSYLSLEKFKLTSYQAIMKYLHIVLLLHTLLYIMLYWLTLNEPCFLFVYTFLKEKRNIKNQQNRITPVGIKLFIEMMSLSSWVWIASWFWQQSLQNILKNSISLKSWFYLISQQKIG